MPEITFYVGSSFKGKLEVQRLAAPLLVPAKVEKGGEAVVLSWQKPVASLTQFRLSPEFPNNIFFP